MPLPFSSRREKKEGKEKKKHTKKIAGRKCHRMLRIYMFVVTLAFVHIEFHCPEAYWDYEISIESLAALFVHKAIPVPAFHLR